MHLADPSENICQSFSCDITVTNLAHVLAMILSSSIFSPERNTSQILIPSAKVFRKFVRLGYSFVRSFVGEYVFHTFRFSRHFSHTQCAWHAHASFSFSAGMQSAVLFSPFAIETDSVVLFTVTGFCRRFSRISLAHPLFRAMAVTPMACRGSAGRTENKVDRRRVAYECATSTRSRRNF